MKFYTDGKARPFSSISIDDIPLEMPDDGPQLFIPIYISVETFRAHTGDVNPIEIELAMDGVAQ